MKSVQVTAYEAFDGRQFPTATECREHETGKLDERLAELTAIQVRAALDRADTDLADALEEAGARIARARRASGEFKRNRTPNGGAEGAPAEPPTEHGDGP